MKFTRSVTHVTRLLQDVWCSACKRGCQMQEIILRFVFGFNAGHSGRAVWGVGLGRLVAGIMGSNPAQGMDVCPLSFCCIVLCR
jgi:hypothetical protein